MYLQLSHLLVLGAWLLGFLLLGQWLWLKLLPKFSAAVQQKFGRPGLWFVGYWTSLTLAISVAAIWFTAGATVFWGLLPAFGLLYAWERRLPATSPAPSLIATKQRRWEPLVLLVFAALLHLSGGIVDLRTGSISNEVLDHIFYSKVAIALENGHETLAYEAIYSADYGPAPYHYYELWIGVALSFGHQLAPAFLSLLVFSGTALVFGLLLGLRALTAGTQLRSWVQLPLAIALCGGVGFGFMELLPGIGKVTDSSLQFISSNSFLLGVHVFKLVPLLIWLLACWLLARATRNLAAALLLSGFLVFLNIAVLPWVCFAAVAWLSVLWKQPANERRHKLLLSLWFMGAVLYMGVFYLLSSKMPVAEAAGLQQLPGMASRVLQFLAPATAVNILGKTFLQTALLFLPLLAVALLSGIWKAPFAKWVALGTGVLYGISATFWALFALIVPSDAVQFFTLSFFPAFIILCWVICLQLLQTAQQAWARFATVGLLLLWGLQLGQARVGFYLGSHSHTNSDAYAQALLAAPLERGIYVHNPKTQNGADWFSKHLRVAIPDYLTVKHATAWPPVPVRDLHIRLSTNPAMALAEDQMRRSLLFFRYYQELRAKAPDLSEDQAIERFVLDHRIDYALLAPGASLPPSVMARVTFRVQDSKSGETLLRFRH